MFGRFTLTFEFAQAPSNIRFVNIHQIKHNFRTNVTRYEKVEKPIDFRLCKCFSLSKTNQTNRKIDIKQATWAIHFNYFRCSTRLSFSSPLFCVSRYSFFFCCCCCRAIYFHFHQRKHLAAVFSSLLQTHYHKEISWVWLLSILIIPFDWIKLILLGVSTCDMQCAIRIHHMLLSLLPQQ